jgi:hypothetical protein
MPGTRALYSLLQYVPDSARAEGANVGVVLFVPETGSVAVRTTPTLARVKKFFSPDKVALKRIELALQSAEHRLRLAQGEFKSEDDFARFVAARADAVRLTPPRLTIIYDASNWLDDLYEELVGEADSNEVEKTAH